MNDRAFKTPTQKRPIPGRMKMQNTSLPEVFTPVYDDSNLSAVICSQKKQFAEFKAAVMMNEQYKKKIEKLQKNIINLKNQKEESLPLLDSKRNELLSKNEYLLNIYQSNPQIQHMEEQVSILYNIQETYTLKIADDMPFRELGILKKSDDISKLPKRLSQLLNLVAQQKLSPFISSYIGVSLYDLKSMSESSLRRRYLVLKQTAEASIKKANLERDKMKSEINDLKVKLKKLKTQQYRCELSNITE